MPLALHAAKEARAPAPPTQERERKERERVVRSKVAASAFARGYLDGLVGAVFQGLQDSGARGAPHVAVPFAFGAAPPLRSVEGC